MDKILQGVPFLLYYIAAIIVFWVIAITLRKSSETVKRRVLYLMCVVNFIFYLINDYYCFIRGDSILTMLPLQLCNIAVFLIPGALLLKKLFLLDFVFYICAPGALAALLIPSNDYIGITYSLMTISFFIFHYSIVAIPFLMAAWGMYKPAPTVKKAVKLSVAVFTTAGVMHILNLILGYLFSVKADYFFTIIKYSAPNNPAFELLSGIIPVDFIYLLPSLLVLYAYMIIVFLLAGIMLKLTKYEYPKNIV